MKNLSAKGHRRERSDDGKSFAIIKLRIKIAVNKAMLAISKVGFYACVALAIIVCFPYMIWKKRQNSITK